MSERPLPPDLIIGVLQSSPTNRRIFLNVLEKKCGAEVRATARPHEALQMIQSGELDVFLGEKSLMTGQQEEALLETVLGNPEIDPPPLILTGYQFGRNEAVELIRSGITSLLLLPFQPESLMEKIRAAIPNERSDPAPPSSSI